MWNITQCCKDGILIGAGALNLQGGWPGKGEIILHNSASWHTRRGSTGEAGHSFLQLEPISLLPAVKLSSVLQLYCSSLVFYVLKIRVQGQFTILLLCWPKGDPRSCCVVLYNVVLSSWSDMVSLLFVTVLPFALLTGYGPIGNWNLFVYQVVLLYWMDINLGVLLRFVRKVLWTRIR